MRTDEQLYTDACRGDFSAFDALYRQYERRLFGFILSFVQDREEAAEVFHDAFCALIQTTKAPNAVAKAPEHFAAWFYTVARNLALNRLRSRRTLSVVSDESPASTASAETVMASQERGRALADAVATLPPRLQEVYRLRHAGLSNEQIAVRLSVPIGTVKSRFHTLVARLRKDLQLWIVK